MSFTYRNHGSDAHHDNAYDDNPRIDNCDDDDLFTRPAATAHIDATIIAQRPDSAFIPATAALLLPLLVFALILALFVSPAAASFSPLYVAHACRQNCEAHFQVCVMAAGVSAPRLASCLGRTGPFPPSMEAEASESTSGLLA
ncbi:hypothetical protein EHS25_001001 [Saitozyma podzolica]|uniref:Uncharacterized protein n=1 Tax=Saitozyma podzolica TaxID=1890683 RepID=A0A427YGZ5_9TREE|nr:hypothetical protein EHS25_001001 [Saitozyma podzolica]